jgi:hypothetical protein
VEGQWLLRPALCFVGDVGRGGQSYSLEHSEDEGQTICREGMVTGMAPGMQPLTYPMGAWSSWQTPIHASGSHTQTPPLR